MYDVDGRWQEGVLWLNAEPNDGMPFHRNEVPPVGSEEINSAEDQTVVRVLFSSQETLILMGVPEYSRGHYIDLPLSRLIYLTVMVLIGRL